MRCFLSITILLLIFFSFQNCGRLLPGSLPQNATGSVQLPSASSVDVPPPRVPLKLDCDRLSQAYTTVQQEAKVSWKANKGTEEAPVPVEGTLGFDALLYKERNATDHQLKLRFDLGGLSTGVALRNQRIRDIVFGSAEGHHLEYDVTVTAQQMQGVEAMLVGQSQQLSLSGNLTLWARALSFSLPVVVTRTATGFQVSSVADFSIGIISQLGMQSQVDQITALCKAVALDKVMVEFNFNIVNACN